MTELEPENGAILWFTTVQAPEVMSSGVRGVRDFVPLLCCTSCSGVCQTRTRYVMYCGGHVIRGRKQSELGTWRKWRGIRGREFTDKNLQIHCSSSVLVITRNCGKDRHDIMAQSTGSRIRRGDRWVGLVSHAFLGWRLTEIVTNFTLWACVTELWIG